MTAIGFLLFVLGLAGGVYVLASPATPRIPFERRRPGVTPTPPLTRVTFDLLMRVVDRLLRRGGSKRGAAMMERAGVAMPMEKLVLVVFGATLAAAGVAYLVGGIILAVVVVVIVPALARFLLNFLANRRQRKFADQLDDALQLMASALRAGHSLLQALDSVSREAEDPAAGEFSRIINETRVGRELGAALEETARRMDSQDFLWVTQAIAINREVGGDLAEVLDQVGQTIRERNQIRRQVKALSAEGKLSAYVLLALPPGIIVFLWMGNPGYLHKFFSNAVGIGMLGAAAGLMLMGAAWLRKVVTFKF